MDAREDLLKRDLHVVAEVGAALRTPFRRAGAAASGGAEEDVEDIREGTEALAEVSATGTARVAVYARGAELLVAGAFLGIGQHFVGLGELFEALLGSGIIRVYVRVMLARQTAVGFADFVRTSLSGDAQNFKIVSL
jgi:hypothetical protein